MKIYMSSVWRTLMASCFLCLYLFAVIGCGVDTSGGPSSGETGDIAFGVSFSKKNPPSGDVCADYRIERIRAAIRRGETVVKTAEWPCGQHSGNLADLTAGGGYNLVIEGLVAGQVHWNGRVEDLTIMAGKLINVGLIQMEYVGDDDQAPFVQTSAPAPGQTLVALTQQIAVIFNESLVNASLTNSAPMTVIPSGGSPVGGSFTYDDNTHTLTCIPNTHLSANTTYTVTVGPDIEDRTGKPMAATHSFVFTTLDDSVPSELTVMVSPANGAKNVTTDTVVTAQFNQPIDPASLSTGTGTWMAYLSQLKPVLHANLQGGGPSLDKDVNGNPILINGVAYEFGVGTQPLGGNNVGRVDYAIGGASRFKATFGITTVNSSAEGDVVFAVYVDGAKQYTGETYYWGDPVIDIDINVSGGRTLTLEVSNADYNSNSDYAMWALARFEGKSATTDAIIVQTGGRPVQGVTTYNDINHRAVFTPTGGLDHNRIYTATLSSTIQTMDGTSLSTAVTTGFISANTAWIQGGGQILKISSAQEELVNIPDINCYPLDMITAFAVDPNDGSLWATDYTNGRLIKVNRDGEPILMVSQNKPEGIAVDSRDGSIWSAELEPSSGFSKLVKRSSLGFKLKETTTGIVTVSSDNAMTWYAPDNSLWVFDYFESDIIKLFGDVPDGYDINPAGGLHHLRIGGFSIYPTCLSVWNGNGITPGHIYASDAGASSDFGRVSVLSEVGNKLNEWIPAGFTSLDFVSADPQRGAVWAASARDSRVAKFKTAGQSLANAFIDDTILSIESDLLDGGLWVGSHNGLAKLSDNGSEIWLREDSYVTAIAKEPGMDLYNEIHVDELKGNDSTGNGSVLSPFQTIEFAMTRAHRGDTVRVAAGAYQVENIQLKSHVRLVGEGYEKTSIIALSTSAHVVSALQAHNAEISGFEITLGYGSGIYALDSHDLLIRNNHINSNGFNTAKKLPGILLEGTTRALISQNYIVGNNNGGIYAACDQALIRNNVIYYNTGSGIHCDNNSNTIHIINNTIDENGLAGIIAEKTSIIVESNIITANGYEEPSDGRGVGIYGVEAEVALGFNNVYKNVQGGYSGLSTQPDAGSISSDPLYMKGLFEDTYYHLATTPLVSPSINTGDSRWFDPDCSRSDMGAYGGPWGNWR